MDPRYFPIALSRVKGVGPGLYKKLIGSFGSAGEVFRASPKTLSQTTGLRPALAGAIASFSGRAPVLEEIDKLDRLGITLIPLEEASYPELLRHISDPPPFLYVRGSLSSGEVRSVALVGSRRASAYGRRISRKIARDLARMGGCVVSGMARGIDTEAHKGALDGGGKTVAVLGCGVDVLYPPENGDLYRAILETGAIVSEFPPGTQPKPAHFPVRNRVISGLSRAVVVLEGTDRSGSLITAGFALDQGREVFALPGPVDSTRSAGPHRLIRDGAALIRSAADIFDELGLEAETPSLEQLVEAGPERGGRRGSTGPLPHGAGAVIRTLSDEPIHIDDIVGKSGIPPSEVLTVLLALELEGVVEQRPGKWFVRA